MTKNNSKNHIFHLTIILALLLSICILLFKKFDIAIKGLLWDVNVSSVKLVKDRIYCSVYPDKCFVDSSNLAVNFGIYDFSGGFGDSEKIAIDHFFLNWTDAEYINNLPNTFSMSGENDRWVLLTVEPFGNNDETLLTDVVSGVYDANVKDICITLNTSPNPVFVRWGHEMERVTGRYPWATNDNSDYINAYNYFVETCKTYTDNAYFVWSPAGNEGLENYYPKNENVDYIGLSLYIYDDFERDYYGYIRNFEDAFSERYDRVKNYGKPIMISEFGIYGSQDLQKYWWYNAQKDISKFPQLKTIIYFNAVDTPGVWEGYDTPDWTVDNKYFPY